MPNKMKERRQERAKKRLEDQLKSGKKPVKGGEMIPLEDKDKDRIKKEINVLAGRL